MSSSEVILSDGKLAWELPRPRAASAKPVDSGMTAEEEKKKKDGTRCQAVKLLD